MYKIIYDDRIEKNIRYIPKKLLKNILKKIQALKANPRQKSVEKLIGINGYRLRVGEFRILFQINDKDRTIVIYRIQHRKDVYR